MQATPVAAPHLPSPTLATGLRAVRLAVQRAHAALVASRPGERDAGADAAKGFELEQCAIASFPDPRSLTVTCEAGALWLTIDHQRADVVLEPGQSYHCMASSRMLVYALESARFRVGRTSQ